jgi:hypothetical protein
MAVAHRIRGGSLGRSAFLVAAAALAVAVLAAGVARGRPVLAVDAAGCIAAGSAVLAGLASWRLLLYGLLVYLPVSGLPILATSPHTGPAVLLKDFLFVLPAYLGFVLELVRGRLRLPLAAVPVTLVTMLALLVCLQALNPALPDRLVGAIGIRVWLFYVPLAFLGYHLVRGVSDLRRVLMLLSVSALAPAVLGIVEAVLFRSGHASTVYRFYGSAAAVATGLFTELRLPSGGVLHRVPSTFSSWTQYFAYVLSMVPVTYAWWRGGHAGRRAVPAAALWFIVVVATLVSGARVAFLVVPGVLAVTLALEHVGGTGAAARPLSARVLAPIGVVVLAGVFVGLSFGGLLGNVGHKARHEFTYTFLHRFHEATHVTWLGLGSGIDTIASRYAVPPERLFAAFGGVWYESWFVKVVLELGVPGLALVVALFAAILWRGVRRHVRLHDPRLKTVSAALIAFLFVNVLLALSKPYLDEDPINVYFWLFAGILARVTVLDAAARPAEGAPDG